MCTTARVSVPWAEREDGERDKINNPLNNRKIGISAPTTEQEGKSPLKQKIRSRDRKVEPDSKQNNKSDPSNTTDCLSLLIYWLSYLHD